MDKKMKLQLSLSQINLRSFLEESIEKGKEIMTPPVFAVEQLEDCWSDDLELYPYEYLSERLLQDGQYLYANFSESGMEREISCIDGNTYYLITQEDYEYELEELATEDDADNEEIDFLKDVKPVQDLYLGETDAIGYVLKYDNNILTVQSGIFYLHGKHIVGPTSTTEIELKENVELFEEPMQAYVAQYLL